MARRGALRVALIAGLAAVVILVAFWAGPERWSGVSAQPVARPVEPRGALLPSEQTVIELFEKTRVSVVYITTQARVVDLWTRNAYNIPRGTGSGFIWDERGHIVTNNHVVQGASGARVRLSDGREAAASLVGVSPAHDLAVLRVDVPDPPPPLPLGSSADLRVGQMTLAIGNPYGLDWTLTTGIVSALGRSLPAEDGQMLIDDLIQTDAAINPGNSGGPLLDSAGRLIGVNTAIFSPSGASAGVGFAVPVDTVNRVVPQLVATGKYVRPVLGIEVDHQINQLITRQLGVKGVVVLRVTPNSPAAAAGLQGTRTNPDGSLAPGDIIVALDGEAIAGVPQLLNALDVHQVGDTVRLRLLRDGRTMEVDVRLAAGAR